MATSKNTIKNWFKRNLFPTQEQFWAWIDSYRHNDDKVPVADIEGLNELLDLKADAEQVVTELSLKADKTYVDDLVTGLWDDRGSYDASTNLFPATGGSGTDGEILKGDIWTISVAGTLEDEVVQVGDTVRALVDSPSDTPSNWSILQNNIGYVPLNYDIDNYSTVSLPMLDTDKFLINRSGAWRKLSWLDTLNSIKTFILGGEIQLPAYTSARNDGALPINKILSVDGSGHLKLYSMPIMPPPYLEELIPDSYLPSTTGNFRFIGSFFTPDTTITVEGQTINYLTFISDNEMLANITSGAAEGTFDVIIDNGIEVVFADALLIVLGDVFTPTPADWENITGDIDLTETSNALTEVYGSVGSARWNQIIDYTKDFSIRFRVQKSPFGYPLTGVTQQKVSMRKISDNSEELWNLIFNYNQVTVSNFHGSTDDTETGTHFVANDGTSWLAWWDDVPYIVFEIRHISGVAYIYRNGTLFRTLTKVFTENMKLVVDVKSFDIIDIKYIEFI